MPPLPQRAENGWPPVVVGSVFQTGLNLMRDLQRHGVRAVGVDYDPTHEGFASIYGDSYHCPDPAAEPGPWVDFMRSLARRLQARPVFIAADDIFVAALGRHAADLADFYTFPPDAPRLQASLTTKEQQYGLAKQYGLPCPRSEYIVDAASLEDFARTARFPCILKPRQQREWSSLPEGNPLRGHKLVFSENPAELRKHYSHAEAFRPEAVVQEMILGPDSAKYCYLSAYGRDGSRLGYCVVQEFRAWPVMFGSASIVEPVPDEEIAEVCDRFLRAVGYVGICEIEVKRDTRDGRVYLVEVNPRFSGTGDCAIYTGVEVGWLHYLDLIGVPVPPVEPNRFHFRHVTLRREVPSVIQYLENRMLTARELFDSYRIPLEFYDFDPRDWRVTARTLKDCLRPTAGAVLRRLGLRGRRPTPTGFR